MKQASLHSSIDQGGGKRRADHFCLAGYFQLSEGPKSRSSFCRVSRRDTQYFTNKSGPAARKSCSTARRQKGLRPLSQACPSAGKRGKIDCSEMGFGVSSVFLRAASFGNSSSTSLVRSNPPIGNPFAGSACWRYF